MTLSSPASIAAHGASAAPAPGFISGGCCASSRGHHAPRARSRPGDTHGPTVGPPGVPERRREEAPHPHGAARDHSPKPEGHAGPRPHGLRTPFSFWLFQTSLGTVRKRPDGQVHPAGAAPSRWGPCPPGGEMNEGSLSPRRSPGRRHRAPVRGRTHGRFRGGRGSGTSADTFLWPVSSATVTGTRPGPRPSPTGLTQASVHSQVRPGAQKAGPRAALSC